MTRLVFLLLILLSAARPAAAQDRALPAPDEPAFPGQAECHVKLPEGDWTPQEHWTWERICLNEIANLSRFHDRKRGMEPYVCDVEQADEWPDHSVLTQELLLLVLTHPRYRSLTPKRGIRIYCAQFEKSVDLSNLEIQSSLWIRQSRFKDVFEIYGLQVEDSLAFNGSIFEMKFNGSGMTVGDNLYLVHEAQFEKVSLAAATIGGDLFTTGATFNSSFHADRLNVGGSVFMGDNANFQDVNMTAAVIGGGLSTTGTTFNGSVNADRLNVGGSVFMDSSRFVGSSESDHSVRLLGATIGGDFALVGSVFEIPFEADGVKVGGALFMRDCARFKNARLVGASVGANLDISASRFLGGLDLTGSRIGGELLIASPNDAAPRWRQGATLTLRNAHATALQDMENAWALPDGALDLNGFSYERLGGLRSSKGSTMADRPFEWLRDEWLTKQKDRDVAFQPQPYRQLATILRESGHAGKADRILYAMRDHQRTHAETPAFQKATLTLSWAFLGYGYRPWQAVVCFAALVLIGTLTVRRTRAGREEGPWKCFFFSLESAVPLIDLTPLNQRFAERLPEPVDWYFHIHKIAGLVLVSVLVAGMTGLVS